MKQKILLSTDIGSDIDDALALQIMLGQNNFDLCGVYTVNGDVTSRAYIAKRMIELSGKGVSIAMGESQPLSPDVNPYNYLQEFLVPDCYIDQEATEMSPEIIFCDPKKLGIIPNGLEHFIQTVSQEKHVVASIGPLTTVARALDVEPSLMKNIEKLYIMGCRFTEGINEHNVRYDIEAARKVLASDIPTLIVPGDVCEKYRFPINKLNLKSASGKYVANMVQAFIAAQTARTMSKLVYETPLDEIFNGNSDDILRNIRVNNVMAFLKLCMSRREKSAPKLNPENMELWSQRDKLLVNLEDYIGAALDPAQYFKQYKDLQAYLKNPKLALLLGEDLAISLEKCIPDTLSTADAYIPYVLTYPDRVTIERATVECTFDGRSVRHPGTKHEIVRDLDFAHFECFLERNLI